MKKKDLVERVVIQGIKTVIWVEGQSQKRRKRTPFSTVSLLGGLKTRRMCTVGINKVVI